MRHRLSDPRLTSLLIQVVCLTILSTRAASCFVDNIGDTILQFECENTSEVVQSNSGDNAFPEASTPRVNTVNQSDLYIGGNATKQPELPTTSNPADELYETIKFYAVGVYTPFVMLVGIVGNLLTLVVLAKGAIISTSAIYLIGLATGDLMYLSAVTPYTFTAYIDISGTASYKSFYSYYVVGVIPLIQIFYCTSTWVTVCFSIERYIAICHPMKAQKFCTPSRARLAVFCVYIISFILGIPNWFSRELIPVYDTDNNVIYHSFKRTEMGTNQTYLTVQYWFFFFILNAIPLSLLAFLNISIVVKLRAASKYRQQVTGEEGYMSKNKSRDRQITRMLLGIVLVHFICSVTAAACSLAVGFVGNTIFSSLTYKTVVIFGNVLSQTNPVLNFCLYANCSKVMRDAMKDLFVSKCQQKSVESGSFATTDTKIISMATIGDHH